MDGDFWFVFNKAFTDGVLKRSGLGGQYYATPNIERRLAKQRGEKYNPKDLDVFYFKFKEKGKRQLDQHQLADKFLNKIKAYVPNPEVWDIK